MIYEKYHIEKSNIAKRMKGQCTFLSLGRYGRFANQLFQIAGTIGIARKNGLEPVFPKWINYDHKDKFGSTEDIELHSHLARPLSTLLSTSGNWIEVPIPWGYHTIQLNPEFNYNLSGHMQSVKYFEHCIDEVRETLTMREEFPRLEKRFVATHVRRGDYDDKYHPRLSMDYYAAAIAKFPHDAVFNIFSDDIHAVQKEFYNWYGDAGLVESRFRFVNADEFTYDYIGSFKLMKAHQNFIVGNSSYSAMAAILATSSDKTVIAPKKWFGESYAGINASDVYCPGWIVI